MVPDEQALIYNEENDLFPMLCVGPCCWQLANLMRDLLLAGTIQKLRLACRRTYLAREPKAIGSDDKDASEIQIFTAIERLHYREFDADSHGEDSKYQPFNTAQHEGHTNSFPSPGECVNEQERRQQRIRFTVTRVDDSYGEFGTVLELTHPSIE